MVSALALGYGVGMSAPDSAIVHMRTAVDGYRGSALQQQEGPWTAVAPPVQHAWVGLGPATALQGQPQLMSPYPGYPAYSAAPPYWSSVAESSESRELSRLRAIQLGIGAQNSKIAAYHSQAGEEPRFALPERDDGFGDVDDLDEAGQEALSRLQLPDFKVPITSRAIRYVRFLTRSDRGRGMFETWLKRSGRYQDLVLQTLREWQMPEDLIWVAMIESGFDPRAKSPAGAVGLWQFMPKTGEVYGLDVDQFIDQRRNPEESTRAAAHHLRDLYQRFGDWQLALASYNMGYEQLLSAIDSYGTTDFSELARQRAIPRETANYVPKIVAAALVANNLERYGFADVKVHRPYSTAKLSIPGGADLKTVAKAAGITLNKLRTYNPHLLSSRVPPNRREFEVFVPADSLSRARAALPVMLDRRITMSDADILDPIDLLDGDGKKARKRRAEQWSEDENLLYLLPKPKSRKVRQLLGDQATTSGDAGSDELAGMSEEFGHRRSGRETVMYRVGAGDTLFKVARQFAVDIEDLARDNQLEADAKLREGSLLKLMVKREVLEHWKKQSTKGDKAATSEGANKKKGGEAA